MNRPVKMPMSIADTLRTWEYLRNKGRPTICLNGLQFITISAHMTEGDCVAVWLLSGDGRVFVGLIPEDPVKALAEGFRVAPEERPAFNSIRGCNLILAEGWALEEYKGLHID